MQFRRPATASGEEIIVFHIQPPASNIFYLRAGISREHDT